VAKLKGYMLPTMKVKNTGGVGTSPRKKEPKRETVKLDQGFKKVKT